MFLCGVLNLTNQIKAHANTTIYEHYQNPVFALTPKDYLQETLHYFMNNMPELFRKATLIQKYTLMKYLMNAYERILERSSETTTKKHMPHFKKPDSKTDHKRLQQLQTTSTKGAWSPIMLRSYAPEQDEESLIELPRQSLLPSPVSDTDLLQIFQLDANKYWNARDALTLQHNSYQLEFEENITLPLPTPQLPAINISDLFENENLYTSNELQLPCLRQQQSENTINEEILPRRSERLQAQSLTTHTANEMQSPSNVIAQRLSCRLRSSRAAATPTTTFAILYLGDSTPATPKRLKPRTYITEEEYSLRFRLPRRRFLEVKELPRVKYNIETSSFAYFPMNMSLIEEEYSNFYENEANDNNLFEVQLQSTNLHEPPTTLPLPTSVLAATTGDNVSSLTVVRQAPSSMMELSSFGRPLPPVATAIDVSRIKEERSFGILQQDMSPRVETVGVLNNDVNVSINSASSGGPHAVEGYLSLNLFSWIKTSLIIGYLLIFFWLN